jgi:hypothetical protein
MPTFIMPASVVDYMSDWRQTAPGPSAMVTQFCPVGHGGLPLVEHLISHDVNFGPAGPAIP